jgi:hypothetical protein
LAVQVVMEVVALLEKVMAMDVRDLVRLGAGQVAKPWRINSSQPLP